MPIQIARVQTQDRLINQLQNNMITSLQPITSNLIVTGNIIQSVALVAGQVNTINHGLNRILNGWQLVRVRSQSTVWDDQDNNSNPASTLLLQCSANVTVDIYVF